MAHPILSLFTTLSLLLLLLPSSSLAHEALFSEPLQMLFGGEKITDGDLTLSLSNKCSLVLYDAGTQVLDFKTTVDSTKHCALIMSTEGQLLLVPDNELMPTTKIGKKTQPGHYALLFVDGKLGIFGPAMWDNGVDTFPTHTTSHHLKSGVADYMLFSGDTVSGSANGDVVIAESNKVSALITPSCTLAVKYNNRVTLWETEPKSSDPMVCELRLKHNGNLLLQRHTESGVHTQWSNGFAGKEMPYMCLLRYNGQMLVYGLKTWLYHDGYAASADAIKMVVT